MRNHAIIAATTLFVAFASSGCTAGDPCIEDDLACLDEDVASHQDELIGGDQAAAGQFDATLYVVAGGAGCTSARVGPRHILTAAHCVMNVASGAMRIQAGSPLSATNSKVLAGASWSTRTVAGVFVHPQWAAACGDGCPNNQSLIAPYPPDVAVIETTTDLPSAWQTAKVYWGPLPLSKLVTVVGYGCETSVNAPDSPKRLKYEETAANTLSPAALEDAYIATTGQKKNSSEASLCFGDSGGPLYWGRRNDWIIGVNAYYTFSDGSGIAYQNLHTRLGTQNDHDVTDWLLDLLPAGQVVGPG